MANLGTVMFRGISGELYRFQVWPLGTRFKPLAGVCIFSKRSFRNRNFADTASHECVHIGHTADLSTVLYDEAYVNGTDCICVHLVPDADRRAMVENDLAESLGMWNAAFRVDLSGAAAPALCNPEEPHAHGADGVPPQDVAGRAA